jgi:hypothetical protein
VSLSPRENPQGGSRRGEKEAEQSGGNHLLQREAGIQAIATTAPDVPPEPGMHATFAREFEYKRHGTVSLLVGIDFLSGNVHALVRDRHRSREFIEFLEILDAAYPAHTAIKLILDNHSAHISKELAGLRLKPTSGIAYLAHSRWHGSAYRRIPHDG